jgi:hypothetical protein
MLANFYKSNNCNNDNIEEEDEQKEIKNVKKISPIKNCFLLWNITSKFL